MMKKNLLFVAIIFAAPVCALADDDAAPQRDPVRRAIAWLAKTMESEEWARANAGNAAGEKRVAQLAAAWLLEANPDFNEFKQTTRRHCREQADALAEEESDGDLDLFSRMLTGRLLVNWPQGFAALYAYEWSLREGKPHPALDVIARGFVDRQNAEGGWGHGPKDWVAGWCYPSTMVAPTSLALLALGAAEREKTSIVQQKEYAEAVRKGLSLLRAVQGPHGGMPYGGRPHRFDCEAGRTASMLLALAALRRTDTELFRRAAAYVWSNMEAIPHGHGSGPLHIALGGLACFILSDEAWRLYDAKVLEGVRRSQRRDGSFGPTWGKPPAEAAFSPEPGGSNLFSTAYTTALYAVALSADRSAAARQLRLSKPLVLSRKNPHVPKQDSPLVWRVRLEDVAGLAADAKTVAALKTDGDLQFFAAASGELLGKVRLPVKAQHLENVKLTMWDGKAVVLSSPKVTGGLPATAKPLPDKGCVLSCCDPKKSEPIWHVEVDDLVRGWFVDDRHASLVVFGGELIVVELSSGRIVHRFHTREALNHFDVRGVPEDRYAFASEHRLQVYDNQGRVVWKDQNRAEKKVTPAGFSTLAASAGRLYAGGSDGRVECRQLETGEILWQLGLESVIDAIHVAQAKPARLLVIGREGVSYGLQDGKMVWRLDAGSGVERDGRSVSRLTAAGLFVGQEHGDRILLVDVGGGRIKNVLHARCWTATNRHWIAWSEGCLQAHRLE